MVRTQHGKNSAMGEKSASFHLMSSECAKILYLQLFPLELRLRGADVQTQIEQIGEGQSVKCQGFELLFITTFAWGNVLIIGMFILLVYSF